VPCNRAGPWPSVACLKSLRFFGASRRNIRNFLPWRPPSSVFHAVQVFDVLLCMPCICHTSRLNSGTTFDAQVQSILCLLNLAYSNSPSFSKTLPYQT
jgi:hypothetical protein